MLIFCSWFLASCSKSDKDSHPLVQIQKQPTSAAPAPTSEVLDDYTPGTFKTDQDTVFKDGDELRLAQITRSSSSSDKKFFDVVFFHKKEGTSTEEEITIKNVPHYDIDNASIMGSFEDFRVYIDIDDDNDSEDTAEWSAKVYIENKEGKKDDAAAAFFNNQNKPTYKFKINEKKKGTQYVIVKKEVKKV